ncbi:NADH-quinone oxidoreductase subunit C [Ammoniphilus sp. 3BR4]|uniref:NADH-quinone oxidoreductase subunit C n=1 Tax=Ammoniphilus sp. 3BR4 TaxID=3158265 RepID=UPI0034665759
MSTPEDKKAAAAKAKEEALRKLKEQQGQAGTKAQDEAPAAAPAEKPFSEMTDEEKKAAKAKAIAEAKAKAAAKLKGEEPVAPSAPAAPEKPFSEMTEEEKKAAKAAAIAAAKAKAAAKLQGGEEPAAPAVPNKPLSEMTEEEKKAAKAAAVAAAKAKAAAAVKAKEGTAEPAGDDEKAKAIAAAKAKAAAAAAAKLKAAGAEKTEEAAAPKEPSPKQPILDHIVKIISQELGNDVIEESYVKENSKHMPTLVVKREKWLETATLLKNHPELSFDYVSNLLGVDYKSHMESVTYFYSYPKKHSLAVRVKTKDREDTKIASIANLWAGANWHERESYDLLGIVYEGHPDLRRIMLTDDWVGHPLRKDYEQYDEEV